jgi:hypothetical protein
VAPNASTHSTLWLAAFAAVVTAAMPLAAIAAPGPAARKPIDRRAAEREARRKSEITASLKAFDADPKAEMGKIPPKRDAFTGALLPAEPKFGADEIASGDFVAKKDAMRSRLCKTIGGARVCLNEMLPGRAPFKDDDQAAELVDNGDDMIRSLKAMDKKGLTQSALDETPWSDHYWALYQGEIAYRYADSDLVDNKGWKHYWNYSQSHDFMDIFKSGDKHGIDVLSPAEKYDLLVGDEGGHLTQANWDDGKSYYDADGKVEDWMGICNGWAPASYMVARPEHLIQVLAYDGETPLDFYPSDIKALASSLWAKGKIDSRFAGGRCNDKAPKTDDNGRILSQACFDTNPGTWHLAIVNQIGVSRRSFVIDATYDYEVWNQPVYSYEYSYFNPQTKEAVDSLKDATVAMDDFTKDKFSKYRSKDAAYVVGIAMDMSYVEERDPNHVRQDSPDRDKVKTVRYKYDLELDSDGEIIGGEWYSKAHPDFLWTPAEGDMPTTDGDSAIHGSWHGTTPMPETWRKAAIRNSKSTGAPLGRIVKILSGLARE